MLVGNALSLILETFLFLFKTTIDIPLTTAKKIKKKQKNIIIHTEL